MNRTSRLLYFTDPMCSWCYGFADELSKTVENLPRNIAFEIIVGGLRADGTETIKEMKDFLTHHWQDVQERSGVDFNYQILDSCKFTYNTEPACRAVVAMKQMAPQKAFSYMKAIQKGFYLHNYSPNDDTTFALQAKEFGVDWQEFLRVFNAEETKTATRNEFALTKKYGVSNFPTLILVHNEKNHTIAQDFGRHQVLLAKIQKIAGH
ncbi:hypothetical protein GC194_06145 [bacterium]|nr:hypothetical protein [bacterium]